MTTAIRAFRRSGDGIRRLAFAVVLAPVLASGVAMAAEQTATLPKSSYQGLGLSSDQPIQIESESLEVHDDDQMAIFTGNVIARQEQTVLKSDTLQVFYLGSTTGDGPQQVKKLDAKGHVLVTSGPQTASGNEAVFDTAANIITMTGDVVLTQGDNVIRGPRLTINVTTNQAKMEGGRVQMQIAPKTIQAKPGN